MKGLEMSREVGVTYSAPMAGAIWLDKKWQTRRTSGLSHVPEDAEFTCEAGGGFEFRRVVNDGLAANGYRAVPRLRVGDVMVVREPWRTLKSLDKVPPVELINGIWCVRFEADGHCPYVRCDAEDAGKFRQAMHMPFVFARSRRVVTGVRVERLGDISEADAMAEGSRFHDGHGIGHSGWRMDKTEVYADERNAFAGYWEKIHKPGAWERDRRKWVWVYEFERRG